MATTTAINQKNITKNKRPYREFWQETGGERLYTLFRWLLFALLAVVVWPLIQQQQLTIWPITLSTAPIVLGVLGYGIFTLCMSIALFIPPLAPFLKQSYLLDVVFFLVLALLSKEHAFFLPLYFAPIAAGSVQQKPLNSLLMGLGVAVLYSAVFFVGPYLVEGGHATLHDYTTLGMHVGILLAVPWLISSLVEHWSNSNRRHILEAQAQQEAALEETERYRERMHVFAEVSAELAKKVNHKHILDTILEKTSSLMPMDVGVVLFSTGRPKEIRIEEISPSNPGELGMVIAVEEGILSEMLNPESTPRLIDSMADCPEFGAIGALESCQSACVVPLRMKVTTFGILLIATDKPDGYTEEHLEILAAMANYAIVAIYNAQMAFDLKQGNTKLLSKEKEVRDQIASKLHDGPTQKVAQIAMNAEFIKKVAQHDPSMLIEELDKFGKLAQVANGEMRMTLFELRPLILETEGLRAALAEYIEKLKLRTDTKITIQTRGQVDTVLEHEASGVLFDIIQESVNNALKYSEAGQIWIRLERKDEIFHVSVQDNGKGFDPAEARKAAKKRASFGLQNFGERAKMVEGTVDVDSAPGKGTTVRVTVPIS